MEAHEDQFLLSTDAERKNISNKELYNSFANATTDEEKAKALSELYADLYQNYAHDKANPDISVRHEVTQTVPKTAKDIDGGRRKLVDDVYELKIGKKVIVKKRRRYYVITVQ